jgi:hypothetical protein
MEQKRKPYRNKAFMRFCHERMRGACCVCNARQWTELHHFGDDGGMGMKPGDLQVARVCKDCHTRFPNKFKAMYRGDHYTVSALVMFQADALRLNQAWVEHLEAKRPIEIDGCSMDELNRWFIEKWYELCLTETDLEKHRDWFVQWADRRAAEMFDHLTEGDGDEQD